MSDIPYKKGDELLAAFFAKKEGKSEEEIAKIVSDITGEPIPGSEPVALAATTVETQSVVEEVIEEEVEPPPPPKTLEIVEFLEQNSFDLEELGEDFSGSPMFEVKITEYVDLVAALKEQKGFVLNFMTAIDLKKGYQNILRLVHPEFQESVVIKVTVDKTNPILPSLTSLFGSADWQEREAFDMIGIIFEGHPNLTRILNPDNWEGHPLRKDYVGPVDALNQPIHY